MRILIFTTLYPNDVETGKGMFIRHRAVALKKAGASVRVIAPVPYFPFRRGFGRWSALARVAPRRTHDGIDVYHPRVVITPKLGMRYYGRWMAMGCRPVVEEILSTYPIDLIDAHFLYPDGYAALEIARALDLKMVVTARGTDAHTYPGIGFLRSRLQRVLVGAGRVFAVSRSLGDDLRPHLPPGRGVGITPNGVDVTLFRPLDQKVARRRLGLPQQGKILVGIGRLHPIKKWDLAIGALGSVVRDDPTAAIRLCLIGGGELRTQLEHTARKLGVGNRVFFAGERSQVELPFWLAAADSLIHPSLREGWPNVVLEALACGTPVLGRRIPAIAEVAPDPLTSVLVPEPSRQSFGDGIREVLERSWDRDALIAHARTYSWDEVGKRILKELTRVHAHPVSP